MPSVHSKNLEIYNAKQFKESVSEPQSSNLYFTFGRVQPWAIETAPPVPSTSVSDFYTVYKNMIGGKKITGNDIMHSIPRFDWTYNTSYSEYDDVLDSKVLKTPTNAFYVVTDEFNVYKCLSNNYGGRSISKPTSTTPSGTFQTADGYIWKYMYSISAEEQLRFTTSAFIPVKTLSIPDGSTQWTVQNTAVSGAIHNIKVTSPGSRYTNNNVWIQVAGDGTGCNAFAVRDPISNTITSIVVDDEGRDYTRAEIRVFGGGGRGATFRPIIAPPGGHGKDPITELGGSYLTISTQFKGTESGKFSVANDFRQVALIEEPKKRGNTDTYFANSSFSQLTTVVLTGVSPNFVRDEYVFQGTSFTFATMRAVVVEWDSVNSLLRLSNVEGPISGGLITGYTSAATRQVVSISVQPELEVDSGSLLYIDNIEPVQRDASQTEDFKIVLSF